MKVTRQGQSLSIEVNRAEAQVIWGSLSEAAEALAADEFEIRVGEPESLALDLNRQLKPVLVDWDSSPDGERG